VIPALDVLSLQRRRCHRRPNPTRGMMPTDARSHRISRVSQACGHRSDYGRISGNGVDAGRACVRALRLSAFRGFRCG